MLIVFSWAVGKSRCPGLPFAQADSLPENGSTRACSSATFPISRCLVFPHHLWVADRPEVASAIVIGARTAHQDKLVMKQQSTLQA